MNTRQQWILSWINARTLLIVLAVVVENQCMLD